MLRGPCLNEVLMAVMGGAERTLRQPVQEPRDQCLAHSCSKNSGKADVAAAEPAGRTGVGGGGGSRGGA